ncbi:MAG: hypothetical protein K0Q46_2541 [Rhodococcus erythropolis]|jgi:hypothetical protein|nr:hypothetical protein [Rhodococcus erythropolis]MDF2895755.1 hypothetical protein [Rhodococcus erythropolis]
MTPEQMRALALDAAMAAENADRRAQTGHALRYRKMAAALRTAADQLEAVQRPANLTIAELDTQPGGTVVVGPDGLIWERSEVGFSVDGRLAWFPLEHEVGSSSHEVGHGARVILTADTAPQEHRNGVR